MTHPFYPPNYALSYDGHIHDVSYILSCDGLINEPGYRLGEISDLNRDLIVETMGRATRRSGRGRALFSTRLK